VFLLEVENEDFEIESSDMRDQQTQIEREKMLLFSVLMRNRSDRDDVRINTLLIGEKSFWKVAFQRG